MADGWTEERPVAPFCLLSEIPEVGAKSKGPSRRRVALSVGFRKCLFPGRAFAQGHEQDAVALADRVGFQAEVCCLRSVFDEAIRVRALDQAGRSGYPVARMRFEIILAPSAAKDLRRLKAKLRATVRDAIERHLRHEPAKVSKSRIKRLRGLSHPQYRLRVEDVRVFYDVTESNVEVLAIVLKSEAEAWLSEAGKPEAEEEESDEEGGLV
jgi:mRNA interferase RelE/StbE